MSIIRIFAATITVLITTLDDAVWLSKTILFTQLLVFILTLEGLAILCCLTAKILQSFIQRESLLTWIAVIICWIFAIYFYCKARRKQLLRRQAQQLSATTTTDDDTNEINAEYGTIIDTNTDNNNNQQQQQQQQQSFIDYQPPRNSNEEDEDLSYSTIVSLTFVGALDELSYFPTLIIGNIFTSWDLCVGTLFASIIIVVIVKCFLQKCKPIMDFLDTTIPLYGIITVFATILTLEGIYGLLFG